MDEHQLLALAARQHGLFTYRQALHTAMTKRMLMARVSAGRFERIRPTVYRVVGAPVTWHQTVLAVCLSSPGSLASHRTALRLWSLGAGGEQIETLSHRLQRVRLDGVRAHRSLHLPLSHRSELQRIPVTTPARTLIDVSGPLGLRATRLAVDEALRRKILRQHDLRAATARLAGPGRRNLRIVRQILTEIIPGYDPGDSELEIRALRILADAGLPLPVQQHRVSLPNGRRCRIDLAYPEVLVAIELDGWAFHNTRYSYEGDRATRNELTGIGWSVYQFTSMTPPQDLIRLVTAALGEQPDASVLEFGTMSRAWRDRVSQIRSKHPTSRDSGQ